MDPVCERCVEREVALRLQQSRARALSAALREITRSKSLQRAQAIARAAGEAEWVVLGAMDGGPMADGAR